MNHLFKRSLYVNKNLSNIKTVFRSISGAEQPKNDKKNQKRSTISRSIFYGFIGIVGASTGVGLYNFLEKHKKERYINAASLPSAAAPAPPVPESKPPAGSAIEPKKPIHDHHLHEKEAVEDIPAGVYMPELKTYSLEEITAHDAKNERIWVIYKEGVYDITEFVESHPGGEVILQAAGSSIEPFWTIYGIHKCNEVYEMLECLRIGNVSKVDSEKLTKQTTDPYYTDPVRDSRLRAVSAKPFNAETEPAALLTDNFYTPNELFYVRNHLPVPVVDLETYKLEIKVEGTDKKLSFSFNDLRKLEKHDVVATLMCAGNRRSEMAELRPLKGLNWNHGVIGNAVWSGVYLRDLLLKLGIDDKSSYKHIQFEGLDIDPNIKGRFYGASVPLNYVMDKNCEVLLAYEMNGEPLPRDHGFPIRVIVPGVCGARNVKWLKSVIVSNDESQAFWQQHDYKSFNSSTTFDTADYSKAEAVQKLPIISAICVPRHEETVKLIDGCITVKGYAFSGGGSKIYRVDVTADEGATWYSADLESTGHPDPHHYGWTLWTVKIPIEEIEIVNSEVELWAKAMDSNHNTQPETFEHIWNIRGILSNAYHRISVIINK